MWLDIHVWEDYRKLCSGEKLRPAEAIEEFVRLVLRVGSACTVLTMLKSMEEARVEGLEAYARVLLDWYTHEKFWFYTRDEEQQSTEHLLLEALKNVQDKQLRRRIEEAFVARGRREQEIHRREQEEMRKEEEEEERERRELFGEPKESEAMPEEDSTSKDSEDVMADVEKKIEQMKEELAARRKRRGKRSGTFPKG